MAITNDYFKINRILNSQIAKELNSLFSLKSGWQIRRYKENAEEKFAKYIGVKECFFVDSGTTAMQLALLLSGAKEGDEIIMPVSCYPSIVLSALYLKLKPVFVDIKNDFTIDEAKIEEKITDKTKVIVPVHLFGFPANMPEIMKIAKKHNLYVIEDAAQAHGSRLNGKMLGSFGDFAIFSFSFHKSIAATAGGAIVSDKSIKEKLKKMVSLYYDNLLILMSLRSPSNMALTDTALINAKLKAAKIIEKSKISSKKYYDNCLNGLPHVNVVSPTNSIVVSQEYVAYFDNRDKIVEYLNNKGIEAKHPYNSAYLLKTFNSLFKGIEQNQYKNAQNYDKKAMLLPMHALIKKEEINFICDKIKEFYSKS